MERKRKRNLAVGLVLAAVVVCALVAGVLFAQHNARIQGAVSMRDTILTSAKECCAVEGSYPSSLSHLEENYGLTINEDDYVVTYEWFADNILPSVVVVPR